MVLSDTAPRDTSLAVQRSSVRRLRWVLAWAVLFTAMHGYWYFGGTIGLGEAPLPGAPSSATDWVSSIVVVLMFAAGLAIPIVLLRSGSYGLTRRFLVTLMHIGALILTARGSLGLLDDAVRQLGLSAGGITGLDYKDTLGTASPSMYTLTCTDLIDVYFLLGGILYWLSARPSQTTR